MRLPGEFGYLEYGSLARRGGVNRLAALPFQGYMSAVRAAIDDVEAVRAGRRDLKISRRIWRIASSPLRSALPGEPFNRIDHAGIAPAR
jgi:hypothetical protein